MATERYPDFRWGNVLTTSFTGTITELYGDTVERIPTPARFTAWLVESGFAVSSCTESQLDQARELRSALDRATAAKAVDEPIPADSLRVINAWSARGKASAELTAEGDRRWKLSKDTPVEDALGVIAADAISLICGERDGEFALCGSPTCRAAFFDTSQSRSRKWCDMNTCGNRQKKARLKAKNMGERQDPGS